jgi:type II secretory pathway predicted ATPase ExeA
MYLTHFGLRKRPFPATLDAECYYPATGHESALAQLLQALKDDQGLALLTGGPGSGKTLLCHRLVDRLDAAVTSAFLTNSHFVNRTALLQAVLYDLSLPYEGRSEQELRLALTEYLLHNYGKGRATVLVIDEAHHLTPDLLEELRLLGNLEAGRGKAVQIVLAAQPGLLDLLEQPLVAGLRQRLTERFTVEPLGVDEAVDYLAHHVRVAGGRPEQVFAPEALELLARATNGVPRLLNQAGHRSLSLASAAGLAAADAEVVLEALAGLGLSVPETGEETAFGEAEPASELEDADATHGPVLTLPAGAAGKATAHETPADDDLSRHLLTSPRWPA